MTKTYRIYHVAINFVLSSLCRCTYIWAAVSY